MSFSITLTVLACSHCDRDGGEVWDWDGMTYNLVPMFRKAGFYDAMRSLAGEGGTAWFEKMRGENHDDVKPEKGPAGKLVPLLEAAVADMTEKRAEYEALNPPNGWGDYEGALRFVEALLAACQRFPKAELEFSG